MREALAFVLPVLLLLALNRRAKPSREGTGSFRTLGDAAAIWLSSGVMGILLFGLARPLSAGLLGGLLAVLLAAGNVLKEMVLHEPLVFSDVFLAGHALRYPNLYFAYAPGWVWPLIAAALGLGAALVGLEPPSEALLAARLPGMLLPLLSLALGVFWLARGRLGVEAVLRKCALTFDANDDAARLTPLGSNAAYILHHRIHRFGLREKFRLKEENAPKAEKNSAGKPRHLVLIQAESFCRLHQKAGGLCAAPVIERMMMEGPSGDLRLDWRGAYTMRTEFSVLTGLGVRSLETYGFDPYRLAAMEPMESLARDARKAGFRTEAWHPNDGGFFDRFRVMPNLGFEVFREGKDFADLPRHGRYASDEALLRRAAERLEKASEPLFLFIVTMEAHGPWKRDRFPGLEPLTERERYERHLASLDRGVAHLREAVLEGRFSADIALYGDHLPGLGVLAHNEGKDTSWCLWSKRGAPRRCVLRPESLRSLLLHESFSRH